MLAINPINIRESVCLCRELERIIQFVRFKSRVWIANLWRTFSVDSSGRWGFLFEFKNQGPKICEQNKPDYEEEEKS